MTLPNEAALQKLQFYTTTPYPCGYLEDKQAQSLIAAPYHLINTSVYSDLVSLGFRRSGKFTYRPNCNGCMACLPVRVLTNAFVASRTQKRTQKRYKNILSTQLLPLAFYPEHFSLYLAYQSSRHSETISANSSDLAAERQDKQDQALDQYKNFLTQSNVESWMVEFREGSTLKMVSVVDMLADGISAVYTFYDTSDPRQSYGTYSILQLIDWCQRLQLPYLYLGYWIRESQKMAYKQRFQPQEILHQGNWQRCSSPML